MEIASPIVSIIIPTYNRSALLMETLDSVKRQDFENWECIVVDDGSIDNTAEVVKGFSRKDCRFKFIQKSSKYPKGASYSRNLGFQISKGQYIQWLDDDDLLSGNKLSVQVQKLEEINNPNVYTICSWDLFWPNKSLELKNSFQEINHIKKQDFFSTLGDDQTFIPPLAYLTPRELIIKSGLWNTELSINQDAEFFARVMVNSDYLANVNDCHVLYRQHDGHRISARREKADIESFFLSLNLIQSYLKSHNIEAKNYFKWKLLKWFLAYRKSYPGLFNKHYYLFKENRIDINYSIYYELKYSLYKKVRPLYKKIKNHNA
ncbi:glycosyltransferase family 2 protein [Salegentibacter mishustinae]|uniref:glycosyltransferase family 2 protein n=1 Tax=Salegentibacter mishustinae TaxID=270918 RepID=UPI00249118EF|nr:glycosyltransferase family 2 protein [Salegentibacter mishustinae]